MNWTKGLWRLWAVANLALIPYLAEKILAHLTRYESTGIFLCTSFIPI